MKSKVTHESGLFATVRAVDKLPALIFAVAHLSGIARMEIGRRRPNPGLLLVPGEIGFGQVTG